MNVLAPVCGQCSVQSSRQFMNNPGYGFLASRLAYHSVLDLEANC